jgi:DnaJ-class molecular chaperone
MDNSDETTRCSLCTGVGQVPDPANPSGWIPCPMCAGMGRVRIGQGTTPEVREYRRNMARSTNTVNFDE